MITILKIFKLDADLDLGFSEMWCVKYVASNQTCTNYAYFNTKAEAEEWSKEHGAGDARHN